MTAVVLLAAMALLSVACEGTAEKPVSVTRNRSEVVVGSAKAVELPVASAAPKAATARSAPRRVLCGGSLSRTLATVSEASPERREAVGERPLPERLAFSESRWTWINFWAAWCVPCKEEIPRLLDWEKRLLAGGKDMRVVFVSLDDDERQLQTFLGGQSPRGLRRTYLLQEGAPRADWLSAVGMKSDMQLPAHLLVDSAGKVRCRILGAVEDADYPSLVKLLDSVR